MTSLPSVLYNVDMNNLESGKVPQTIDAAGNIVPKPYGVSRWATPRMRACKHADCENNAVVLRTKDDEIEHAHNCCAGHEGGSHAVVYE